MQNTIDRPTASAQIASDLLVELKTYSACRVQHGRPCTAPFDTCALCTRSPKNTTPPASPTP